MKVAMHVICASHISLGNSDLQTFLKRIKTLSNYLVIPVQPFFLFSINKNRGICLKNLPLRFCRFLPASHPERQPAVLACLAGSTSLLLKAMNLKRQHVVGTTLGGSHTHTHTHSQLLPRPCSPFPGVLQKAFKRVINCSARRDPAKK